MKPLSGAIVMCMLIAVSAAFAEVQTKTARIGTTTVHYKVVVPKEYDPAKPYPAVLAFGGGAQTMETVDLTLQRNWQKEAESRGYIVILPAAPDDVLFFQGGEKIFPKFIVMILANYKILGNKFHAAGYSNGGTSAFLIAALYPQYFLSITAFPGYLLRDTSTNLKNISKLCINMYVGELDSGFLDLMRKQSDQFRESGLTVKCFIEKGQGHILGTLGGGGSVRLFNNFDEARQGCEGSHTEHEKRAYD
jgi:predicted peptidase